MALGSGREFVLKIVADVKDATKEMDKVAESGTGLKSKFGGVGKAVMGGLAIGAVVSFGKASISAASDAQQSMGAMSSVFGDFTGDMEEFGSTSAEQLGITQQSFNQMSALTGSLLKNAGLPMDQVTQSTQDLTQRAADLAAMFGTDVTTAVGAMSSAFKGEFDPLEQFGVSLKASDVNARALAEGYVDASGEVTDAGKAIAAQEIIMEQSAGAAGTFAEESDTLAGQTQIMTAKMADAQAEIGSKLLPVMVKIMGIVQPVVDLFAEYAAVLVPLAAVIGGIVAVQWAWNAALAANPIVLIAIGIAAIIAALVLLYNKVDWFRQGVDEFIADVVATWDSLWAAITGLFNWVKKNWPLLLAILTGPIGVAVLLITRNWDKISSGFKLAMGAIGRFVSNMWSVISGPFKRAKELITGFVSNITDAFRKLPSKIAGFFSNVANVISGPFKSAFNAIKTLWNNTVGGFGFSVPSWVPGVGGKGFKIPMMAAGGIVRGPTIAMLGEAGPEAVIPLSRGGFGNVTINVYALTGTSEVGRHVYDALKEYERTSGKAIA